MSDDLRVPVELEVCAVCGTLRPKKLWGGARVVSGPACAHGERRPVRLVRRGREELAELIADEVLNHVQLLDEYDEPAPRDHYLAVAHRILESTVLPSEPHPTPQREEPR